MQWPELLEKLLYTTTGFGVGWILRDLKETLDLWLRERLERATMARQIKS